MPPSGPIPYPADGVRGVRPSSHLGWAIASTLLCCIPAGIVSIVYAVKVNTLWDKGDGKGAASASKTAKAWAWFSFGLGIAGNIVILALDPSRYGL